jgi:hypothetical protein
LVLTDDQAEHFLARGHVTISGCFTAADAQEWLEQAWVRLGYDPADPRTWQQPRVHMPALRHVEVTDFAPRAYRAACELLGGEDRVELPWRWSDSFIVNFGVGADRPWEPPSADVSGWHKDGDFFRHFLDSPEQGLLVFVVWSDIRPRGGGTFVAADSVPVVARFLAEHPEGVLVDDIDFASLVTQCSDFVEVSGRLGDVVLLHPYVLHAVSQNILGIPRFITNPPIALREPLQLDRDDPAQFSLVEQAVLRGLGVERFDFRPRAPREQVVPERVRRQAEEVQRERARLLAAGHTASATASRRS